MAVIDTGTSSAGKANVDAFFNLNVNTPIVAVQAGLSAIISENDAGTITTRSMRAPYTSIPRRLTVGMDTVLFDDSFGNTAQDTSRWRTATTTFTLAQASGYVVLNSGAVTTTGASQIYQSYRYIPLYGGAPLIVDMHVSITAAPPTNWTFEAGLFATTQPFAATYPALDGVHFRMNSTGLIGVLNYNGTETVSGTLIAAGSILVNQNIKLRIVISHKFVEFWAANNTTGILVLLGTVNVPAANGQPIASASLPVSFRLNQPGTASAGVSAKISDVFVHLGDMLSSKPWSHQMASIGQTAYEGQPGGTLGSTALLTNSLAPGAGAAMTNTAASLGSGLGGQFTALPTLAQNTDGIVCSYQNPFGSVSAAPRTLYITGVSVKGIVLVIFTGGPVYYLYSLAYGHTAVSLATAEGIAAKAPRRIALGLETYVVTAPVGTVGQGVSVKFETPIVVNPGEFIALVAKNLGTVTSLGNIMFSVTFDGYSE